MTNVRNYITFAVLEELDPEPADEETPPGRLVANKISELLGACAYECGEVSQHSHYGWSFEVGDRKRSFWLLLQSVDPFLLIVVRNNKLLHRLFGARETDGLDELLSSIFNKLKANESFSEVVAYSSNEFENRQLFNRQNT